MTPKLLLEIVEDVPSLSIPVDGYYKIRYDHKGLPEGKSRREVDGMRLFGHMHPAGCTRLQFSFCPDSIYRVTHLLGKNLPIDLATTVFAAGVPLL